MVIKYFENRTLFCRNNLHEKTDAQVVPKNKNKVRTIRCSDQLMEIVWTLSYIEAKQNSRVVAL